VYVCNSIYSLHTQYILQYARKALLYRLLLKKGLEAERLKRYTITNEMLAHGLDPVQTQRVQHGTSSFHDTENHDGQREPETKDENHQDRANNASVRECVLHGHLPQDDRETLMGEGQSPETEVGGSVGDTVETEFCEVLVGA
jgi:hypothetical protein